MGTEIERKFLVKKDNFVWLQGCFSMVSITQGYISDATRIRIVTEPTKPTRYKAFLHFKSKANELIRKEWTVDIEYSLAYELLDHFCQNLIVKKRYLFGESQRWEIDVFCGKNKGLIVAEIELENKKNIKSLPSWIGKEVTGIDRFYNSQLYKYPYSEWEDKEKRWGSY